MQRVIKGFSKYSITKEGVITNLKSGKFIKHFTAKDAPAVTITNDEGIRLTRTISGLVKLTFPELFEPEVPVDEIVHLQGDLTKALLIGELSSEVLEIRQNFKYSPSTGFITKVKTGNLGWLEEQGYRVFDWKGESIKAHRLIFLLMLGYIPEGQVDHINHDRADNRWINLRVVSKATNSRNLSKYANNSSGTTGISWHKKQQKWVARIMVNNKAVQLGSFESKEEAIAVRQAAVVKYNFHENHGDVK
jgi:hypothetical protein